MLSSIVSCPPPSTTITLPLFALTYLSTWPFKSSVTVRVTVREVLMLMSAASLTVPTVESAIALVSSDSLLTSFSVSFPPINVVKAVSGWGSDTSPSGWGSDTSFSGWGSDTSRFAQFSGKAPSAPQTGQAVFMFSAVQAVSQLHSGGVSVLSSAKAARGTRQSTMHRANRMLTSCFFIMSPSSRCWAAVPKVFIKIIGVKIANCQAFFEKTLRSIEKAKMQPNTRTICERNACMER